MSGAQRPVVLVHGAWHGGWCWSALQAELDQRGVPSYALDLPGHGTSPFFFGDLHSDAASVVLAIERLGRDVVLVGHSYGGAVITEAALHTDRVAHLVYLTAFVLDEGESMIRIPMLDALRLPPTKLAAARQRREDGTLTLDPELAVPALYGRCSAEVQQAAVARLGPQPIATFVQPVTGAGWRRTASTYIRCTADEAVPLVHQDAMAQRCGSVFTLETDHSPFASMPAATAEVLLRVLESTNQG
jgi:pimeloyl-ACP methyl ester carboxylesterase